MRIKRNSLLCGVLTAVCILFSFTGTVYEAYAEEAEAESAEYLEELPETTDEQSDTVTVEEKWLSLGENPVQAGETTYLFRPNHTGYYQFACSYMMIANVRDADGRYLQEEQCLGSLSGLHLEVGSVYTVETSASFDDAILLIREMISEVGVGAHQPERSGLYLFKPDKEGYYSFVGNDFEVFAYIYDDFEGEWYEEQVSRPEHCYLLKQNYYIWVRSTPAELEISSAKPHDLQEGTNEVSEGWYQFSPKVSGFYEITNLRAIEGGDDAWFFYEERPNYGFAGAEGYYLSEGQNYRIRYEDTDESTISRITNVIRSKEGLDYFVYQNRAMVIGYGGPNRLVWPEKIDALSVCLLNKDLHQLFHRNDSIAITFPASMIGFRFDISYEWNEWQTDSPSVVAIQRKGNDPDGFAGQLLLKNSGTAKVLLTAGDAEEPSHEHQYHITIKKAANENSEQNNNKPNRSENGGFAQNRPNKKTPNKKHKITKHTIKMRQSIMQQMTKAPM